MTYKELSTTIKARKSFLCLGLDPDVSKLPVAIKSDDKPLFRFCKEIADAVSNMCVAFKINTAFFEAEGSKGFSQLEELCNYLHASYPGHFLIADAKRADIGNTSHMYARAFFETLPCDAITLHPYMGKDSIEPFLTYENKWAILLALTSNPGSADFEQLPAKSGDPFYLEIMKKATVWATHEKMMFVVGATKADYLADIRKLFPHHFLLIPGMGAQRGDLEAVIRYGSNEAGGLLINVSRDILYSSPSHDFAAAAAATSKNYVNQMANFFQF